MTKLTNCDHCGREYMRKDTLARNKQKHKFCSVNCRIEGLRNIDYRWGSKKGDLKGLKEFMGWTK